MSSQVRADAPAGPGRRVAIATAAAVAVAGLLVVCTPAQAHAVQCGETITRDTTLHRDLTNWPGDGLVIGADDITLDLNGYTIDGVQTGERDCGVQAFGVGNPDGHDGVTIKNGTIREFGDGIRGGFGRSRLHNLTVRDNRNFGIVIVTFPAKDDIQITQSLFARNGCGAIGLVGPTNVRVAGNRVQAGAFRVVDKVPVDVPAGINLIGVNEGVVRHNSVSGGTGIVGVNASLIRIEHNAVSGSSDGVFLVLSDDNWISENSTSGNYYGGIGINSSSRNRVTRNSSTVEPAGVSLEKHEVSEANVVIGNRSVRDAIGVLVEGSDENEIVGNRAVEAVGAVEHTPAYPLAGGFGVVVDSGSDNVIAANMVERPEKDGVKLLATPAWGGVATGNVLRWNVVRSAGGDGVRVESSATGSLLEGNVAVRAADDGFDVAGPATLIRNRAFRNGSLGIRAGLGVTDGGANRARANGDPAQCTSNIACG
jgi:parallel beta-helix repeat protein